MSTPSNYKVPVYRTLKWLTEGRRVDKACEWTQSYHDMYWKAGEWTRHASERSLTTTCTEGRPGGEWTRHIGGSNRVKTPFMTCLPTLPISGDSTLRQHEKFEKIYLINYLLFQFIRRGNEWRAGLGASVRVFSVWMRFVHVTQTCCWAVPIVFELFNLNDTLNNRMPFIRQINYCFFFWLKRFFFLWRINIWASNLQEKSWTKSFTEINVLKFV